MARYAVITQDDQGNYRATIVQNQEASDALRDRLDAKGVETYGSFLVVPERSL